MQRPRLVCRSGSRLGTMAHTRIEARIDSTIARQHGDGDCSGAAGSIPLSTLSSSSGSRQSCLHRHASWTWNRNHASHDLQVRVGPHTICAVSLDADECCLVCVDRTAPPPCSLCSPSEGLLLLPCVSFSMGNANVLGWNASPGRCGGCGSECRWRRASPFWSHIQVKCFRDGHEGGCGWSEDVPDSNGDRKHHFTQGTGTTIGPIPIFKFKF